MTVKGRLLLPRVVRGRVRGFLVSLPSGGATAGASYCRICGATPWQGRGGARPPVTAGGRRCSWCVNGGQGGPRQPHYARAWRRLWTAVRRRRRSPWRCPRECPRRAARCAADRLGGRTRLAPGLRSNRRRDRVCHDLLEVVGCVRNCHAQRDDLVAGRSDCEPRAEGQASVLRKELTVRLAASSPAPSLKGGCTSVVATRIQCGRNTARPTTCLEGGRTPAGMRCRH